jgi:hypothetical protein
VLRSFGIHLPLVWEFSLSDQGFQGAYHGLAECFDQVRCVGLLLTVLVFGGFLVSSWRLWEPQQVLGVHGSRLIVLKMENGSS